MIYRKMTDYNLDWKYIKQHKDILHIGEELSFELKDGTATTLQVAAINPDGNGNVALVAKNITHKREMNSPATNKGGWEASEMRKWLNEEYIDLLPDELVSIIEPRKLPDCGCTDKLWLLSRTEAFGKKEDPAVVGSHFALNQTNVDRIKSIGGSASAWWLRSPYTGGTSNFWYVTSSGAGYYYTTGATTSIGVAWGIMI